MKNENAVTILLISEDPALRGRLQKQMGFDYSLELQSTADRKVLADRLIREQPRLVIADADSFPGIVEKCAAIFGDILFVSGTRPGVLVLSGDDRIRAAIPDDGHWLWTDESDLRRRAELLLAVQRIRYGDAPGESQSVMHTIQSYRFKQNKDLSEILFQKKRIR